MLLMLAGCGYHFTADSGIRLDAGQRVWVPFFKNNTAYPSAQVALKRAIFDQFSELRGILPATGEAQADLLVSGAVTGYGIAGVSYSSDDQVREYRLTISAEVAVSQQLHGDQQQKILWKGTISAWQDYPATQNLEIQRDNEEAALVTASKKLAQQLIWNLEQNY